MAKKAKTERNAQIIGLRSQGVGPREIARRLGLTGNVVAGVLHRHGLCAAPMGRGNGATEEFKALVVAEAVRAKNNTLAAKLWGVSRDTVRLWKKEAA